MLVSILINNYNYGKYLKSAIDSAINQNYFPTEIIVVDDGSTDQSKDIILSYGTKITSIFKENGGQASAFNAGFKASKGELIFFLDSDDFFLADKVRKVVDIFYNHSSVGFIFHKLQYIDEHECNLEVSDQQNIQTQVVDFRKHFQKGKKFQYSVPCGLCFRRRLLEKILPMPEAETVTLSDNYLKYAALGLSPGMFLADKLAVQRIHSSNIYTFRKNTQKLKAQISIKTGYYLKNNFPQISLFADKIFARGFAEMILEKGIWKTLDIQEVKKYPEAHFSVHNKLFILPRVIYHLLRSFLTKANNNLNRDNK